MCCRGDRGKKCRKRKIEMIWERILTLCNSECTLLPACQNVFYVAELKTLHYPHHVASKHHGGSKEC